MGWSIAGNSVRSWLIALATVLVVTWGAYFVKKLMIRLLKPRAEQTRNHWDDHLVNLIQSTKSILFFAIGVSLGANAVRLSHPVHQTLHDFLILTIFYQVGLWANRAITLALNFWIHRIEGEVGEASAFFTAGVLARVFVWMILLLLALQNMGVNITTLIAGLGVGGIAIGLALQQVAGDMFASLAIVLDKPFVIGDFIALDTFAGTIERVGIKTTRLRSLSGEELIFPNTDMVKGRVHNYRRMTERRVVLGFGVTYDTDVAKLEAVPDMVRDIIAKIPQTRFDRANLKAFGASSLDFEVVYYVLSPDYYLFMDTQEHVNLELIRRFRDIGVEFAFPTQTLYVEPSANWAPRAESDPLPAPRSPGLTEGS